MKTKILVISTACLTSINREIYRRFDLNNYDITLLVPSKMKIGDSSKVAEPKTDDDPKIIFGHLNRSNPRTMLFRNFYKIINDLSPNIIILDNDPVSFINFKLSLWKKKKNFKLVNISCENIEYTFFNNFFVGDFKLSFKSLIKKISLIYFKKYIDLIFTINNDGKKLYEKAGFNNVVKIPLGINENIFSINKDKRNKLRAHYEIDCTIVSFFGRMIYEKGFHLLIEALGELKQFKWKLMIDKFSAYKSDYMSNIDYLLNKHSLSDRVIYVDPTHDNINEFMNASDLIIIPSLITKTFKEQYCRVAAEAMACGKNILSSKSGALPELIGSNGTFFDIENKFSLILKLKEFFNFDFGEYPYSLSSYEYASKHLSVNQQYLIMQEELLKL